MTLNLDAHIPSGPIEDKWTHAKFDMKLVNPANRRKYKVIVVGSGLAGGAAAATLAELGYDVACFCFQDSPRRAHSIAAHWSMMLTLTSASRWTFASRERKSPPLTVS